MTSQGVGSEKATIGILDATAQVFGIAADSDLVYGICMSHFFQKHSPACSCCHVALACFLAEAG
jgi:hypothetical protein